MASTECTGVSTDTGLWNVQHYERKKLPILLKGTLLLCLVYLEKLGIYLPWFNKCGWLKKKGVDSFSFALYFMNHRMHLFTIIALLYFPNTVWCFSKFCLVENVLKTDLIFLFQVCPSTILSPLKSGTKILFYIMKGGIHYSWILLL